MDVKFIIGQKIRKERLEIGLSQEALANKANIDRTYLPSIEKGTRNLSVDVLIKICKALNVTASDFLKDLKL